MERECKYLGVILTDNMCILKDVERVCNSFLQQFNSMYSRFNFCDIETLSFLFKSYCSSFYASELWFNREKAKKELDTLSIVYHKAIKRVVNLSKWDNNHDACCLANLPIFKHFLNNKLINFVFSIINSKSPCIANLKTYFVRDSFLMKYTQEIFTSLYEVENVLNNDLAALKSRINFVERNETRSNYVPNFRR